MSYLRVNFWKPERFWAKVTIGKPNECWLWTGQTVNKQGGKGPNLYGRAWDGRTKRLRPAHVLAWELYYKRTISRPHIGMHKCDVTLCCNPKHIKRGTLKQNTQDMIRKGRAKLNGRPRGTVFRYKDGTQTYGYVK